MKTNFRFIRMDYENQVLFIVIHEREKIKTSGKKINWNLRSRFLGGAPFDKCNLVVCDRWNSLCYRCQQV